MKGDAIALLLSSLAWACGHPRGSSEDGRGDSPDIEAGQDWIDAEDAPDPPDLDAPEDADDVDDDDGGTSTTDGVHWLDPLGYQKPAFLPIVVPDETTCPNRYFVDQADGGGSECTETAPCDWSGLEGKPGTAGGPAYVHLRGDARLELTGTLYGTEGAEVVIVPWPGSAAVVTMTAGGTGSRLDANRIDGPNVHHIVMDGGPDLLFSFVGSGPSTEQNSYTLTISSSYITVARTRIHAGDGYGPALGVGTGTGSYHHIYWINNEMYDSTHYYGVYTGGGTGCTAGDTSHSYVHFLNNIFRNICGRGIQIEPRDSADHTYVMGNAFHDVGYGSCIGQVSAAVQPADACGGEISETHIENNLMFDLGGGGVTLVGTFPETHVYNNTIYDYAKSTPLSTASHGIGCITDGCPGTVRNNIVLGNHGMGINPLNRSTGFTATDNLCETGTSCGSDSRSGEPETVFASTSPDDPDFLKLAPGSSAIDEGYATGVTGSYFGDARTEPLDIGADEL